MFWLDIFWIHFKLENAKIFIPRPLKFVLHFRLL